jgi:hypothetical protein
MQFTPNFAVQRSQMGVEFRRIPHRVRAHGTPSKEIRNFSKIVYFINVIGLQIDGIKAMNL